MGVAGVLAKEAKGARCGSGCGEKREGGHVGRHLVLVGLEKKRKEKRGLDWCFLLWARWGGGRMAPLRILKFICAQFENYARLTGTDKEICLFYIRHS